MRGGKVEIDDHCRSVIQKRMSDHSLEPAELHDDVRTFSSQYLLTATGITCGFPCQASQLLWYRCLLVLLLLFAVVWVGVWKLN